MTEKRKKGQLKKIKSRSDMSNNGTITVWPGSVEGSEHIFIVQTGVFVDYKDETADSSWINNLGPVNQTPINGVIHDFPVVIQNLDTSHTYRIRLHMVNYQTLEIQKTFPPDYNQIIINTPLLRAYVSLFIGSNPPGTLVSYRIPPGSGSWTNAGSCLTINPTLPINNIAVNSEVEVKVKKTLYHDWIQIVSVGMTDNSCTANLTQKYKGMNGPIVDTRTRPHKKPPSQQSQ